jgi:hypothetical protein
MVYAFLKIMRAAGAVLRLRRADPIHFRIDLDRFDQFYHDTQFRASCGLLPLPKTKHALRLEVKRMRANHWSFHRITQEMNTNRICTWDGELRWHRFGISRLLEIYFKKPIKGEVVPLVPGKDAIASWRSFLLEKLFAECAGPDPMFRVRYGLQCRIEDKWLYVRSSVVITTAPRAIFMANLEKVHWVAGAWEELGQGQNPGNSA